MKARVNQIKPLLSVGMIVKNEAANLPNCLDALAPLTNAIPVELIVVDTGSTDGTKEIAAQYTNKVYDFPWINDFAAARNETLKHAAGEWYMFLDADEWFEDLGPLIDFFQDKEALARYNCATLIIRNYSDTKRQEKMDFNAARIVRCFPDVRFEGKIHEYLQRHGPEIALKAVAGHYGYTQDDGKADRKTERNLPILLDMLEKGDTANPAHTCLQIGREYGSQENYEKAAAYQRCGIAALRPELIGERCGLYHDLIMGLCFAGRWDEALAEAKEFFAGKEAEYATDVDVHLFLAEAYEKKGDLENCRVELEHYFRLRALAEAGTLPPTDLASVTLLYTQEGRTNQALRNYAMLVREKEPGKALAALEKLGSWKGVNPSEVIQTMLECVEATENWRWLADHYEKMKQDGKWRGNWILGIDHIQESREEARGPMAEAFGELPGDDPFVTLILLRGGHPAGIAKLEKQLPTLPADMSSMRLLYYAMANRMDIEPVASCLEQDELFDLANIFGAFADAGDVIDAYYTAYPEPPSLCGKRWKCVMQERILVGIEPGSEAGKRNFVSYCHSLGQITFALYGEPSAEAMKIIPHSQRFGIYMRRAEEAKGHDDMAGYVRMLQEAVTAYPVMKGHVKPLLNEVQESLKRQQAQDIERASLFVQLKEKIRQLIKMGDHDNAAKILEQYAKLNPKDDAINYFWQQIKNPVDPS